MQIYPLIVNYDLDFILHSMILKIGIKFNSDSIYNC